MRISSKTIAERPVVVMAYGMPICLCFRQRSKKNKKMLIIKTKRDVVFICFTNSKTDLSDGEKSIF